MPRNDTRNRATDFKKRGKENGVTNDKPGPGKKANKRKTKRGGVRHKMKKEAAKERVVFTRDNINSHLVNFSENPADYKVNGILSYLFKEFRETPEELLAKLKVMGMRNKKIEDSGNLSEDVMNRMFVALGMKEDFYSNMFRLLYTGTFLSDVSTKFYLGTQMDTEAVARNFTAFCDEVERVWKPKETCSWSVFEGEYERLVGVDDLVGMEEYSGAENVEPVAESGPVKLDGVFPEQVGDAESDFSLVSLDDAEKMEQLDVEIGKIFGRGVVSEDNKMFSLRLLECLEVLIRNNYIPDIKGILRLFCLFQHDELFHSLKSVTRSFLEKFGDKGELFQIYERSVINLPNLYRLTPIMMADLGDEFRAGDFVKIAINQGYGHMLIGRMDSAVLYGMYGSDAKEELSYLVASAIEHESSQDKLSKLQAQEGDTVVAAALEKKLRKLEAKASKQQAEKEKEPAEEVVGEETVPEEGASLTEEEESDEESEMPDTEEVPQKAKKSFKERIGKRLAEERDENRKKFRMKNLKTRSKENKKAKAEQEAKAEERGPRITKALLREDQSSEKSRRPKRKN